jgi:hypothetical protein
LRSTSARIAVCYQKCSDVVVNMEIGPIVLVILVSVGMILLLTGVGGGGFNCTTGQWFVAERTTPTENRVVGAIMIAFAILLSRLKPK